MIKTLFQNKTISVYEVEEGFRIFCENYFDIHIPRNLEEMTGEGVEEFGEFALMTLARYLFEKNFNIITHHG
jgi:hypothetical protein